MSKCAAPMITITGRSPPTCLRRGAPLADPWNVWFTAFHGRFDISNLTKNDHKSRRHRYNNYIYPTSRMRAASARELLAE